MWRGFVIALVLVAASCTIEATGPDFLPQSNPAMAAAQVGTVDGKSIHIEELGIRDLPIGLNRRGWVLTAFSLLKSNGEEVRLAPEFWPRGMNQAVVVGYPNFPPRECPVAGVLDTKTSDLKLLETLSEFDAAQAEAVNSSGDVTGWMGLRNESPQCGIYFQQAVVWSGDEVTKLPPLLPGDYSLAYAINQSGDVAGVSGIRAVTWEFGNPIQVGPDGAHISYAFDLNDAGMVAGFAQVDDPAYSFRVHKAFIWEDGDLTFLPGLGGHSSFARGVNNNDLVVGSSIDADSNVRATLWYGGEPVDLGTLGGSESEARAVSDRNEIVGWAQDSDGIRRPAIWRIRARAAGY